MTTEIRYLAQQLLHAGLAPLSERDARVIARVAKRVHIALRAEPLPRQEAFAEAAE